MAWYGSKPKWLDEVAAFAVPALTTLAGSALLPGAGGPLAQMLTKRAMMAAAGAGAKGLGSKEEEDRAQELMKRREEAQRRANMANALSPGSGFRAVEPEAPKKGLLETVAKGTSQGLQVAQLAETANMARQKVQQELTKGATEQALEQGKNLTAGGATLKDNVWTYPDGTTVTNTPALHRGYQEALLAKETAATKLSQEAGERFNALSQQAIENVDKHGYKAGLELFKDNLQRELPGQRFSEGDYKGVLNAMEAVGGPKFSDTMKQDIANFASREDAIASIRVAASKLDDEEFNYLQGSLNEVKVMLQQGAFSDNAKVNDIMAKIGFTTEQILRDFSGAAITDDEFKRFSHNFVGGLRGGRENLLLRLDNIETAFRNQRGRIIDVATDPTAILAGIQNEEITSVADLEQLIKIGSVEAEKELARRTKLRLLGEGAETVKTDTMNVLDQALELYDQDDNIGKSGALRVDPLTGSYADTVAGVSDTMGAAPGGALEGLSQPAQNITADPRMDASGFMQPQFQTNQFAAPEMTMAGVSPTAGAPGSSLQGLYQPAENIAADPRMDPSGFMQPQAPFQANQFAAPEMTAAGVSPATPQLAPPVGQQTTDRFAAVDPRDKYQPAFNVGDALSGAVARDSGRELGGDRTQDLLDALGIDQTKALEGLNPDYRSMVEEVMRREGVTLEEAETILQQQGRSAMRPGATAGSMTGM